jgi:hypothetical protein
VLSIIGQLAVLLACTALASGAPLAKLPSLTCVDSTVHLEVKAAKVNIPGAVSFNSRL